MARDEFGEFVESMPKAYRDAFDKDAIAAHAAIVARREGAGTRVEMWRELPERIAAVCIVADDRPGLLSQISAALVAEHIDVVSAHAFVRRRPEGGKEAVDLLQLRRVGSPGKSGPPLRAQDVAKLGEIVDRLVHSTSRLDAAVDLARAAVMTPGSSTRVLFDDGAKDGTMLLTVEATDRPGLLLLVTQAIFRAGLQIIGLRATSESGRAVDRFHLAELDGKPLVLARLLELQVEIFAAIENGGEAA